MCHRQLFAISCIPNHINRSTASKERRLSILRVLAFIASEEEEDDEDEEAEEDDDDNIDDDEEGEEEVPKESELADLSMSVSPPLLLSSSQSFVLMTSLSSLSTHASS